MLLFACLVVGILLKLGFWQWQRAVEKERLLGRIALQQKRAPVALPQHPTSHSQHLRVKATGQFLPRYTVFVSGQFYQHRTGFEVYTLFEAKNHTDKFFVDRGWVAHQKEVKPLTYVTLKGFLLFPKQPFELPSHRQASNQWPLFRPQFNLTALKKQLPFRISSAVIKLTADSQGVFVYHYNPSIMRPVRHRGYALQWFTMALVASVAFLALAKQKENNE